MYPGCTYTMGGRVEDGRGGVVSRHERPNGRTGTGGIFPGWDTRLSPPTTTAGNLTDWLEYRHVTGQWSIP